jgi:L-asparaginase/Glu-tRNA(Gln) amidotransferase subunit D
VFDDLAVRTIFNLQSQDLTHDTLDEWINDIRTDSQEELQKRGEQYALAQG